MFAPFKNEILTDFSRPENCAKMESALSQVAGEFGRDYPIIIGKKCVTVTDKISSFNPSNKNEVVGTAQKGDKQHALDAVHAAWRAFDSWKDRSAEDRAGLCFKIAANLRERKFELASWMVYEIGKSWTEADGDVAEAIDFCEFYARGAIRLGRAFSCPSYPGETNSLVYIPLGVGAVIPPWNFPLAILTGMTMAAIVAGNTVVLKPASLTPVIAAKFMEIALESGLPPGVINFVTGSGSDVGETLITHPRIRFISFTGSREVGLHIVEESGRVRGGQKWIKRVVAEMGGKDAIIVDSDVSIDSAVEATVLSAFGFQGQKCSACSRAIVDEKIYDAFLEKLKIRVARITMGPAKDYENYMGPVAGKDAYSKILDYISIGRREARLICGGEGSDKGGFFIEPTIFADVLPSARIAREEIFGPVLAVIKSKNIDDAIAIFNDTDYGLTGGICSRDREKIERAKRECFCGNFYVNRKITGATVAMQPFGGYNMSGTCSKAGGMDYLALFLQAKTICERFA